MSEPLYPLLPSPHEGLTTPCNGEVSLVKGEYLYYHYGCDGLDDRGWGCGYRTLQSLSSWVRTSQSPSVPSNGQVQETLVKMQDKEKSFIGSKQWIGCVEAGLVMDELYGVPCRITHIASGCLPSHVQTLHDHFTRLGSPVMMGGDSDNMSKAIVGVASSGIKAYLLIVDPHFFGKVTDRSELHKYEWVQWKDVSTFESQSFYNLCLPQKKYTPSQ